MWPRLFVVVLFYLFGCFFFTVSYFLLFCCWMGRYVVSWHITVWLFWKKFITDKKLFFLIKYCIIGDYNWLGIIISHQLAEIFAWTCKKHCLHLKCTIQRCGCKWKLIVVVCGKCCLLLGILSVGVLHSSYLSLSDMCKIENCYSLFST